MNTPETIRSEPTHFRSQPGSRKIWIVLCPRFSGFHDACDILKVASWPLGFIILAAGDGRTFMLAESLAIVVLAAVTWISATRALQVAR